MCGFKEFSVSFETKIQCDYTRYIQKLNDPTDKTVKIVEGWKREFRYVYGDVEANLSSNNKLDVEEILRRYGIFPEKILCLNKHKYCFILFKHILVY